MIDYINFIYNSLLRLHPENRLSIENVVDEFVRILKSCKQDADYCTKKVKTLVIRRSDISAITATVIDSTYLPYNIQDMPLHIGPVEGEEHYGATFTNLEDERDGRPDTTLGRQERDNTGVVREEDPNSNPRPGETSQSYNSWSTFKLWVNS